MTRRALTERSAPPSVEQGQHTMRGRKAAPNSGGEKTCKAADQRQRLIPLTQVRLYIVAMPAFQNRRAALAAARADEAVRPLDVVCREVGRVRSPGRTHDGQGALAFRIPEGIF